jgi:molybdate transport system substrate-binding protein
LIFLAIGALLAACGGAASPTASPEPIKPAAAATTAPPPAAATPAEPTKPTAATTAPAATPTAAPAAGATKPAAATPAALAVPKITGSLVVFTAASLTEAFSELGKAVEAANSGTTITFNFAGSPTLRTQLREGAKADIFAAADEPNMQGAQQDGTIGGDPRIFVHNKLVAIVAQPKAGDVTRLQDLAKPGLKLVLAQAAVPVGNYARQSFDKMSKDAAFGADFGQKALANVVSEEANVRQVVTKVQLGEADAGIVYSSDVTPTVRPQVKVLEIPDAFNVIARYPIAPVKGAGNPDGAKVFIDYVLSPAGQAVLQKWGFIPVGATGASASAGATPVQLTGLVEQTGPLTVAILQQLPAETVQATYLSGNGEQRHTYKGARLYAVLNQAKVKENAKYKNDKLRKYVVVSASDGYEAVIAWGEIDPESGNAAILLAYEEDGKPLGGADGPLRLIVPTDKRGGRYVSGVIKVEVRDPDSPART